MGIKEDLENMIDELTPVKLVYPPKVYRGVTLPDNVVAFREGDYFYKKSKDFTPTDFRDFRIHTIDDSLASLADTLMELAQAVRLADEGNSIAPMLGGDRKLIP